MNHEKNQKLAIQERYAETNRLRAEVVRGQEIEKLKSEIKETRHALEAVIDSASKKIDQLQRELRQEIFWKWSGLIIGVLGLIIGVVGFFL